MKKIIKNVLILVFVLVGLTFLYVSGSANAKRDEMTTSTAFNTTVEISTAPSTDDNISSNMVYRTSKKGEKISLLGNGSAVWRRIPNPNGGGTVIDQELVNELIDYAYKNGVNYYDSAPTYLGGLSQPAIGIALSRYPRDTFYVAAKLSNQATSAWSREGSLDLYYESFENLQVDYIDFYLLHGLGMPRAGKNAFEAFEAQHIDNGMLDFLLKEREAGRIRNLGFSYHGGVEFFDYLMSIHDEVQWDFAQFVFNYVDWEHGDERPYMGIEQGNGKYYYDELVKRGIALHVMQPVDGGGLVTVPSRVETMMKELEPDMSVASWGFRFAGSLPNVQVILSGMTNMDALQDNLNTFSDFKPLTESEFKMLEEAADIIQRY